MLACASLVRAIRSYSHFQLPFEPVLLLTGQEATELEQVVDALNIEPDRNLGIKSRRLNDAAVNARLLDEMESALRKYIPTAILVAGYSASAWAVAVAAYFKDIPVIHLGAGQLLPGATRQPLPEWLHSENLARLTRLHLCGDAACAESLKQALGRVGPPLHGKAQYEVVGWTADDALSDALVSPPPVEEDPTLRGLRPGAPRVLLFLRRREHHADALRPLCDTLETLAQAHEDHEFIMVHSLQSHICNALTALLPQRPNVRGISPLPYPAFAREVARARLVVTDSAGVLREALRLNRPAIAVGDYALTGAIERLAAANGTPCVTSVMEREALDAVLSQALAQPLPGAVPVELANPAAGRCAFETLLRWWKNENLPVARA
jgi:UDP-N-acetylglucosamine 2-epimerase (non-hydrolysing)